MACSLFSFHLSTNRCCLFHTSVGEPRQRWAGGAQFTLALPLPPRLTRNERAAASPHEQRLMQSVFDDVHRGLLHLHTAVQCISGTTSHYGNAAPEGRRTEGAGGGRETEGRRRVRRRGERWASAHRGEGRGEPSWGNVAGKSMNKHCCQPR